MCVSVHVCVTGLNLLQTANQYSLLLGMSTQQCRAGSQPISAGLRDDWTCCCVTFQVNHTKTTEYLLNSDGKPRHCCSWLACMKCQCRINTLPMLHFNVRTLSSCEEAAHRGHSSGIIGVRIYQQRHAKINNRKLTYFGIKHSVCFCFF